MNLIAEVYVVLTSLKIDAEMALDGSWDKSDAGFKVQIKMIDKILTKIKAVE